MGFFWVRNSMEAYFMTLEVNMRFMVIRVSKTVLGAERCTFLTYRGYINTL